jgi:hypothetical protein
MPLIHIQIFKSFLFHYSTIEFLNQMYATLSFKNIVSWMMYRLHIPLKKCSYLNACTFFKTKNFITMVAYITMFTVVTTITNGGMR